MFVTSESGGDIYLLCQMGLRSTILRSQKRLRSQKTHTLRPPETPPPHSSNGHPPTSTVASCQPVIFVLIGCWLTACHHGSLLHVTVQKKKRERKREINKQQQYGNLRTHALRERDGAGSGYWHCASTGGRPSWLVEMPPALEGVHLGSLKCRLFSAWLTSTGRPPSWVTSVIFLAYSSLPPCKFVPYTLK